MTDRDRFASLIPQCHLTSSQEEKFQHCPFAREEEVFPTDDMDETSTFSGTGETLSQSTLIVMVDPPESSSDDQNDRLEEEKFHTPPEFSHSQQSGNEVYEDAQRTVELGEDWENPGFSVPVLNREINVDKGGKDLENLGFSEPAVIETERIEIENESRKNRSSEGEFSESPWKKSRICTEKIGTETPCVMIETERIEIENGVTENLETETEEPFERLTDCSVENADNVFEKMPEREIEANVKAGESNAREENHEGDMASKNIDDIERLKYVSSEVRRELPFSMRQKEKDVGKETTSDKDQVFKDRLNVIKMFWGEVSGGNEDVDLLETVKKRGLTFPRPRWLPPEGFGD